MISAVSRTLAILEELSNEPNGATVSELVMRLGIEKSVVSRVLATLQNEGYVVRDEITESFRIGLRLAGLVLRHIDLTGIPDLCLPMLRDLAAKTGELIQLAIVQNDQMIYVAKAEGQQRIRMLSLLGRAAVLHASSAGKVWLASLPEDRALALALTPKLERFTDKTITRIDQFRSELARVRKHGYATVDEELIEGAAAVAVPVRDRSGGRVLGAVVLSGPTYRLSKRRITTLVPALQELAGKLTGLGNIDIHFGGARLREPEILPAERLKQA
jgi:DNA-binding IclR family transcriptional regulator